MSDLLSRRGLLLLGGTAVGAALGAGLRDGDGRSASRPVEPVAPRQAHGWLRPPGALVERDLLAACLRCGQCLEACPFDSIELAGLAAGLACGMPFVDSRAVPCELCAGHGELLCIEACPTDALSPVETRREIRMGVAIIDRDLCLSWQGITCRACWHTCPFPNEALTLDWRTRPSVVAEACIGCGKCDHVCLTEPSSILMIPWEEVRPGGATHVGQGSLPF